MHKNIKIYISKTLITIIITLILLIFMKASSSFKNIFYKYVYDTNFSFTKVSSLYNKYFGNVLSLPTYNDKTVFNDKINYSNKEKYYDGVKLSVDKNYLVNVQESGIVVFIHELGHIITGIIFKWKIDKIIILPFGCLTKFNVIINKPIKEEFIISIMGIIFQILFTYRINNYYNIIIIIFNLIPIYPLDGSKILNLFLNKISNFKLSYLITIYISYIVIFVLVIYIIIRRDIISFIILIPLIVGINREFRNKANIINKFYLERYLYKFNFKKRKIINNISKMKRDYIHIIKNNDKYVMEEKILKNLFDK